MSGSGELPWYQSGLSFECTGCGNCCSGPAEGRVWVDDEEIEALAEAMELERELFERRFCRRIDGRMALVEYSDGDCILLDPDSRGCLAYAARPRQCRTWPFWPKNLETPQRWAAAAKGCPGCNRGRRYSLSEIVEITETTPPAKSF